MITKLTLFCILAFHLTSSLSFKLPLEIDVGNLENELKNLLESFLNNDSLKAAIKSLVDNDLKETIRVNSSDLINLPIGIKNDTL